MEWYLWVVAGVAVVATLFAVVAVFIRGARERVVPHYPLALVSVLYLSVPAMAAGFGLLISLSPEIGEPGLTIMMGVVLAAIVIVLISCLRAARGAHRRGPYLPALSGFGIPLALAGLYVWEETKSGRTPDEWAYYAGLGMVALVGGVNGVMAAWVNRYRRERELAGASAAS